MKSNIIIILFFYFYFIFIFIFLKEAYSCNYYSTKSNIITIKHDYFESKWNERLLLNITILKKAITLNCFKQYTTNCWLLLNDLILNEHVDGKGQLEEQQGHLRRSSACQFYNEHVSFSSCWINRIMLHYLLFHSLSIHTIWDR